MKNYNTGKRSNLEIKGAIRSRIFTIRGMQVMIDRDLAELYGVTTKRLNEQVKRNEVRFPESFRFRLTKLEVNVPNGLALCSLHHKAFKIMSLFSPKFFWGRD